jgi:hypothetical protein
MRWPYVSRELYEREKETCNAWRLQSTKLFDSYHLLKLQGAVSMPDPNEYIEPPLTVDEEDAKKAQEDDGN